MSDTRKIVSARIIPPVTFGSTAAVHVEFLGQEGVEEFLFSFFDDEISFTAQELIGLTVDQANELRHKKDVAYLQS